VRQNAIRLAMFGLGLAATPVLAQGTGGATIAPVYPAPAPVYAAPVAQPLPAPAGYDAQSAPNPPGIRDYRVTTPAYPAPNPSALPAPAGYDAQQAPNPPGIRDFRVSSPAYPAPNPSALPAPAGHDVQMAPNAPGIPAAGAMRPATVPTTTGYIAPVAQPAPARPMPQAAANPALPMQGDVLNGGDRTSAVADSVAPTTSPVALLGQAEQAARQGRLPLASELVERAESLLLTRSTIAGTESVPVRDGAVARMAQARVALGRRDVNTATALMAEAASMTRTMGM